jgi:AmiR/NasT family two-component response regulator
VTEFDSPAVSGELEQALAAAYTQIRNLELALISSRTIGTAMGILMATFKVTSSAAFDLLRAASQQRQEKLRAVAETVVLTGALPSDGRVLPKAAGQ